MRGKRRWWLPVCGLALVAGLVGGVGSPAAFGSDPVSAKNGDIDFQAVGAGVAEGLYRVDPGLGPGQVPEEIWVGPDRWLQDVSPDGTQYLYKVGAINAPLRVYDSLTQVDRQVIPGSFKVSDAAWSPDGGFILFYSFDQVSTWVLDIANQVVHEVDDHVANSTHTRSVEFSPVKNADGSWRIAFWGADSDNPDWGVFVGDLVFDAATGFTIENRVQIYVPPHIGIGDALAWTPDGNWVLTEQESVNSATQPLEWDCSWKDFNTDLIGLWAWPDDPNPPLGFSFRNLTTRLREGPMTDGVDRGLDNFSEVAVSPDGTKITFRRDRYFSCVGGVLNKSDALDLWTADLDINQPDGDFLSNLQPHTDFGIAQGAFGVLGVKPVWQAVPGTDACSTGPDSDDDNFSDCVERTRGTNPGDSSDTPNRPPVADPGGPYAGSVGEAVSFDGSGSSDVDGALVSYEWDFGDGKTGTGVAPSHTYTDPGTWQVTLTVTDDEDARDSAATAATITAVVDEPPVADPGGPYFGIPFTSIRFDGSGSFDPDGGSSLLYSWDFGDDTIGFGVEAFHDYSSPGKYTVTLTVTDDEGDTDTATTTAEIHSTPPPGTYPGTHETIIPGKPFLVALGDSYASGEGALSYDPDTDIEAVNHCHRSYDAYPFEANGALKNEYNVVSLACSGAEIEHVRDKVFCGGGCQMEGVFPGPDVERPQLVDLEFIADSLGAKIEVVTLGIGGNDAGFGKVISGCVLGGNCVNKFAPPWGELPGDDLQDIALSVGETLDAIHDIAPSAEVVLVGYPVFLHSDPENCPEGIGENEALWIREQVLTMNQLLEQETLSRSWARFLSLETVYGDDVHCNPGNEPLLHALRLDHAKLLTLVSAPFTFGTLGALDNCIHADDVGLTCRESYHPKATAHFRTGQALADCLSSGRCGPPAPPPPLQDTTELIDDFRIDYCPDPVPFVPDDCWIGFGLPFSIEGFGFSPDTVVDVHVFSEPVYLGSGTTDATGRFRATVTIPEGAAPPGAHDLVVVGPGDTTLTRASVREIWFGDRFLDVPSDHVFYRDVTWLANHGITRGCDPPANDSFCPDGVVTRGQMAAFLVRALGYSDDGSGDLFVDDDDSIFESDIDKLATAGVTFGCNPPANDRFCPNDPVTRGQMAAFLVRALGYTDDGGGDLFVDDDGSVFESDIDKLGTAGVTRGCNPPANDRFCPNHPVIRGQMAAFLHRALG